MRKKRIPHVVEYRGKTYTFCQLAEISGVRADTIRDRWNRGKREEDLLTMERGVMASAQTQAIRATRRLREQAKRARLLVELVPLRGVT